ncbi:hypothetical protein, partial [Klebsiella pneumoniae]
DADVTSTGKHDEVLASNSSRKADSPLSPDHTTAASEALTGDSESENSSDSSTKGDSEGEQAVHLKRAGLSETSISHARAK